MTSFELIDNQLRDSSHNEAENKLLFVAKRIWKVYLLVLTKLSLRPFPFVQKLDRLHVLLLDISGAVAKNLQDMFMLLHAA